MLLPAAYNTDICVNHEAAMSVCCTLEIRSSSIITRPDETSPLSSYIYYIVVVVVAVLTLTHRYNAVRGHRTGSNN